MSSLIEILTKDPPTPAEQAALAHLHRVLSGVVVIDHHPLGFLHAAYWVGEPRPNAIPDGYKTARRGQPLDEFRDECVAAWPGAEVRCVLEH